MSFLTAWYPDIATLGRRDPIWWATTLTESIGGHVQIDGMSGTSREYPDRFPGNDERWWILQAYDPFHVIESPQP